MRSALTCGCRALCGRSAAAAVSASLAPPLADAVAELAAAWEALRTQVLQCTKCPLHLTRTQGVFGVGPRRADWLVIGEAPGAEEDRRGEPFVGAAGQLLDAMLRAIGLDRATNVYIANVLKSRPPGNRDPKPEEVAACLPYPAAADRVAAPEDHAGRRAHRRAEPARHAMRPSAGCAARCTASVIRPLVVTYHPAYLLRTPAEKRKAWEDLKFARNVYQQLTQGSVTDGNRA